MSGRSQYARAVQKFVETSAPSSPPTGIGYCYEKTDGKLYFKNSAGTEYDLTSAAGGSGNGVDELQWGPAELGGGSANNSSYLIDSDTEFNPRCFQMLDNDVDVTGTPLFRIPAGALSNLSGGQYHKIEAAVFCTSASGNVAFYTRWFHYDQSTYSRNVQKTAPVVAITQDQLKIVTVTWDRSVEEGDSMYFLLGRNAVNANVVDSSNGTNDTLSATLDLLWIRYSTTDTLSS